MYRKYRKENREERGEGSPTHAHGLQRNAITQRNNARIAARMHAIACRCLILGIAVYWV